MAIRVESYRESDSTTDGLQPFCEDVATLIGAQVTPKRVENLIRLSNEQGFITHGIKRNSMLEKVTKEGVSPLTPEGGYVSFWTCGWRTFAHSLHSSPIRYMDTPFFDYGFSKDEEQKETAMAIAITSKAAIEAIIVPEVKILPNSVTTINRVVPPQAMHLLIVKQGFGGSHRISPVMFELLENVVHNGFPSKSSTVIKL